MIEEEARAFFDECRGFKIKWDSWGENHWFIPIAFVDGDEDGFFVKGIEVKGENNPEKQVCYNIHNGFGAHYLGFWEKY